MLLLEKIIDNQIDVDAARELLLDIPCWFNFDAAKIYVSKNKDFSASSQADLYQLFSGLSRDCFNIQRLAVAPKIDKNCQHQILSMVPTVLFTVDIYSSFSNSYLKVCFDYDFDPSNDKRFGIHLYLARERGEVQQSLPFIHNLNIESALEEIPEDLKLIILKNLHVFR